ncbi:MAG: hypothetical protein RR459_07785, partial [Christensenellaceae bacterium]
KMILRDLKKQITMKLDEFANIEPNFTEDNDIALRLPYAINEAIRFAFLGKSLKKKWEISQADTFNLLSNELFPDEIVTHTDKELSYTAQKGYAYCFEVDDSATIKISNANGVLKEIIHTVQSAQAGKFVRYKGFFNSDTPVSITFSGDTYYCIRNVAIFGAKFSCEERIPNYAWYNEYPIPANLYQIETIIDESNNKEQLFDYAVVGGYLKISSYLTGKFIVEGSYFPEVVDENTPNTTEIDVPMDTQYVIIAKACAILTQDSSEYADYIADSEQGMQMLENRVMKGGISVRKI